MPYEPFRVAGSGQRRLVLTKSDSRPSRPYQFGLARLGSLMNEKRLSADRAALSFAQRALAAFSLRRADPAARRNDGPGLLRRTRQGT
jgi:hypothetical protein